jgi:hypothetical protein
VCVCVCVCDAARALEEATRLERRRLDHEGTAWKALLTRRKAAVNLRLERLGEDCEAQWAMLAHLRKQVDSTVEYQQGEEQSRNMKRHALEKENVKWGRKLEIAERTLPENIKTRLKLCAEARLEKLKELDLRAVKDEAQIGIDKANYNKFVVEQEEEQNRQDLREEELGIAVQEAAKSVTEMHNIHRLQRAEWDNQRLPALVEKVRECKAAKSSHITECAQRDIELREEIVFRYEQLEVSKKEAAEAGVERRRADQEDQVAHATVELQFKQAHDARLQVLAGEEVALREAHALDVAAMNRELDEFRVQVPSLKPILSNTHMIGGGLSKLSTGEQHNTRVSGNRESALLMRTYVSTASPSCPTAPVLAACPHSDSERQG